MVSPRSGRTNPIVAAALGSGLAPVAAHLDAVEAGGHELPEDEPHVLLGEVLGAMSWHRHLAASADELLVAGLPGRRLREVVPQQPLFEIHSRHGLGPAPDVVLLY